MKLPANETFEGAVPPPAAQLACLASLAAEGEEEGEKGEQKGPKGEKGGKNYEWSASKLLGEDMGEGGVEGGKLLRGGESREFDQLRHSFTA